MLKAFRRANRIMSLSSSMMRCCCITPVDEKIIYLNQTGSLIWSMCDGHRNVKEIVELLCQAYPDAEASVPQGCSRYADGLSAGGMHCDES